MTTTTTTKRPRSTKAYKALIAANFTDDEALTLMGDTTTPRKEALVDAGLTAEQAEQVLTDTSEPKPKKGKKAKGRKKDKGDKLSSKERGEALVAKAGLAFTRGRVYGQANLIEAQVRVLKTGKPEVVAASGVGHVSHILVYREESGDVAMQNLKRPA